MKGTIYNKIGFVLAILLSALFLFAAFGKFTAEEPHMLELMRGKNSAYVLGSIQILMVVLLWIKRTRIIGALLMIAYMGGAIATHMVDGQDMMPPIVIEALVWVMAFFRFDEFSSRLLKSNSSKPGRFLLP